MSSKASISIKHRTEDGETTEILRMTQEEYNQIISQFGIGRRSELKLVRYSEALKRAQAATLPEEELTEENFGRVDTDGFEKTVVLLKCWLDMMMREMFKKRNFRIEINYNAEAMKTDFAIYTLIEGEKDGIQQEHPKS